MQHSMAKVLLEAGSAGKQPYVDTPMDFVEKPGWNVWQRQPCFQNFGGIEGRPLRRIPNDYVEPPLSLSLALFTWLLSVGHLGIHVIGWKYPFPTTIEWYLWQITSLSLLSMVFAAGMLDVLTVKPGLDFAVTAMGIWRTTPKKNTIWRRWALHGPALVASVLYLTGKTFLIVEAFASLRLMSESAYRTVQWTGNLVHGT